MHRINKVQYSVSVPVDDHVPIEKARQIVKKELTHRIAEMLGDFLEFSADIDWQYNSRIITGTLGVVKPDPNCTIESVMPDKTRKGSNFVAIFEICGGNPGALQFLADAYRADMFKAEVAFQRMQDNNITGTKLYMLWNDCCGRDTKLAVQIAHAAPIDKIVEHINYEGGRGFPFTKEELAAIC